MISQAQVETFLEDVSTWDDFNTKAKNVPQYFPIKKSSKCHLENFKNVPLIYNDLVKKVNKPKRKQFSIEEKSKY